MNIGEKLLQIRVSNKLSQEEMGKIIKKSQQVYDNLEKGKTKRIDIDIVNKIKERFSVDLLQDNIVTRENQALPSTDTSPPSTIPNMDAIITLIESNRILAEAALKSSESRIVEAETSRALAVSNKELIGLLRNTTANAQEDILIAAAERIDKLIEVVSEISVEKKYPSKAEAYEDISRYVYGTVEKTQEADSSHGVGS